MEYDCSISHVTNTSCHQGRYKREKKMLESGIKHILEIRLGSTERLTDICLYHEDYYVTHYSHNFGKKCADPDQIHKKSLQGVRLITEEMHNQYNVLIPGKKLCNKCFDKYDIPEELSSQSQTKSSESQGSVYESSSQKLNVVQNTLDLLGLEKIDERELQRLTIKRRIDFAKVKIKEITDVVKEQFAVLLEVSSSNLAEVSLFDDLLQALIEKYKNCDKNKKTQILSLIPDTYTAEKINLLFGATDHMIRKARNLKEIEGILPDVQAKSRQKLDPSTKNAVEQFYKDNQHSSEMSGMRDYVSIRNEDKVKIQVQKRLLLYPLKELFQLYKNDGNGKIGFSKFADLRPKNCVLAGDAGTHNCCVCVYCQNLKMMLEPLQNATIIDVLQKVVCNVDNESCMLGDCEDCKTLENVEEMLELELEDYTEVINYKQWTARSSVIDVCEDKDDFISSLSRSLIDIKPHFFINKVQKKYLKDCKDHLNENECIVVCDFAENYSFIVQDAIQSYYFNTPQATLHPFCLYYIKDGILITKSFCVISDHLTHDTVAFYSFQKVIIDQIRLLVPAVNIIKYFSDGSSAQYKNKKNFSNIMEHENDFKISAEWNFFASCHGKGPCDAIGASVKRFVRNAAVRSEKITTPVEMFNFCEKHPELKTSFLYVSSKDVIKIQKQKLNKRFKDLRTVANTRKIHCLRGDKTNKIKYKAYSASVEEFEASLE